MTCVISVCYRHRRSTWKCTGWSWLFFFLVWCGEDEMEYASSWSAVWRRWPCFHPIQDEYIGLSRRSWQLNKISRLHPAVSMSCHVSLIMRNITTLKFSKKEGRRLPPEKNTDTTPAKHHPYHLTLLLHAQSTASYTLAGACPAARPLSAASTTPATPAMRWRGMEGFVVREPFEMRARGGVVALLLRDDGSTRNLGTPRAPSFSRSRQAFHAKRSGRLAMDVIFNFT